MPEISFLDAVRQLFQSKEYQQFKYLHDVLSSGINTTISSGDFHMSADFINEIINELANGNGSQYVGMEMKINTVRKMLTDITAYNLSSNPGAARFVQECRRLLDLHTKKPEAFTSFVVPVLEEFVAAVDELVNSTNMLSIENADKALAEIIKRLKREDRVQAAAMVSKRSAEFINLVNDPTSSFSEVNEAVSSGIVTALSLIELALTDAKAMPVAVPINQVLSQEKTEVAQADTRADTPAPGYKSEFPFVFNQVKNLKIGSKEYNAKIKFFSAYISNLSVEEIQVMYKDAAKLVFNGTLEDTALVNKLFNIK